MRRRVSATDAHSHAGSYTLLPLLSLPSQPHLPTPQVLPSLQVEGHPHMFALGDVNNVPEAKL